MRWRRHLEPVNKLPSAIARGAVIGGTVYTLYASHRVKQMQVLAAHVPARVSQTITYLTV